MHLCAMALRRSKRLANIKPEIVETEFECFFCKLRGFTCRTNVMRTSCCSAFCHKTCQDTWAKTWNQCGRCRLPFAKDVEETEEQQRNDTSSTGEHFQIAPANYPAHQASREEFIQLRRLISNTQVIEELLSFKPMGYTETVGNTFIFRIVPTFDKNLHYYACIYKDLNWRSFFSYGLTNQEDSGCILKISNAYCFLFLE